MTKYDPSLFDTEDGVCWKCGYRGDTARHEVYYGVGRRDKSKKYGLWLCLCPRCHMSIHRNPSIGLDRELRKTARELFCAKYSEKRFIEVFMLGIEKSWED